MKKLYSLLIVLSVAASSCQQSQFSTTTRQYRNGRVSYVNTHHRERINRSKCKPETGKDCENLIASTSDKPIIIVRTETPVISRPGSDAGFHMDTVRPDKPSTGAMADKKARQIIEFKSGGKDTVRVTAISNDTLYYHLISNPNILISVTTDKIDTVFVLKVAEPLGVAATVLGVLGLVPVFGLPLAVTALVFGIVSLKRYRSFPERYKRKRLAVAGIVLGAIGIFVSLFFLIV
jgi:hypothetical protein